jgi:Kdo2-lipid IVA lauroyltransferase/acyltransferase
MGYFVFLVVYPILWCISMLPFRLLYLLSDFVFLIVYYLIGYRKKTVRKNINLALPHLSNKERLVIERKSYQHLCDMFLEMIKTITISENEINKRFTFSNLEVYKNIETKNKSIALMVAHYASYEWVISLNKQISFKGFAIYKKLNNQYFNKLVIDIRKKFKAILITTKETIPTIESNFNKNILGLYGFASDQSPRLSVTHYWRNFMGIETNVHTGAEMLSKKYDMNVLFLKTQKIKRGYYQGTFVVLSDDSKNVPDYQITDKFLDLVEQQIHEAPEYYLWTHNRWKHTKSDQTVN